MPANLLIPAAAVVAILLLAKPRRRSQQSEPRQEQVSFIPGFAPEAGKTGGASTSSVASTGKAPGAAQATIAPIPLPTNARDAMRQLQTGLRAYQQAIRTTPRVAMPEPSGMTIDGVFGPVTARYLAYFQRTVGAPGFSISRFASGRASAETLATAAALLAPCGPGIGTCPTVEQLVASQRSAQVWNTEVVGEMAFIVQSIALAAARSK